MSAGPETPNSLVFQSARRGRVRLIGAVVMVAAVGAAAIAAATWLRATRSNEASSASDEISSARAHRPSVPPVGVEPAEAARGGDAALARPSDETVAPAPDTALASEASGPIRLRDVTDASGVDFVHCDGSSGRLYIIETVASGLATFDYDQDGLIDIYFVNGGVLPGYACPPEAVPRNRLFRNLGGWRFADVTDQAGVGDTRHGLGTTVGDVNNDGYLDLYVSNWGANVLYLNNGDGTFRDASTQTGTELSDPLRVGAGVCCLDIEADGNLDVFAANYLQFSPDHEAIHMFRGKRIYPGPERFPPYPNTLLRNNGDLTFADVSAESGIAQHPGFGMGIVCGDFNQDGATDVFVGNDGGPGNYVFLNDGQGRFEEVGAWSGAGYSGLGLAHGSMGADCADYDQDGLPDLFVTSYQRQLATLFRNRGAGMFEDVTQRTGAGLGSFNQVTWGCALVDLDNDGRRDIFYACGHLIDNIDQLDDSTSYLATPIALWRTESGRFVDVSGFAGDGLRHKSVGRGVAVDDLDNDGRLDVVILNSRRPAAVLRNTADNAHHWLQVRLIDPAGNRDGVGAQVALTAGEQVQHSEMRSGRGYQSHFGSRLHFGLGAATRVNRLEVRWLGGRMEVLEDLPVDRRITIIAGRGLVAAQ